MPSTDLSDFALLLRGYRSRRGLTQEELAERASISIASVSLLERGLIRSPQKGTLHLLARALDLSAEERDGLITATRAARAGHIADEQTPAASLVERQFPTPLTAIIGREHDEVAIVHLLSRESTRLLTVTGPAGVGKTRLALQVAHTLSARDEITPCFVPLVAARNPAEALGALALALGVRERGALPLRDVVISALRAQRLLLVLDNFEQIAPAGSLIVDVLGAAPLVKALVTSRERLNVRGEQIYTLAPLETPDTGALPDMEALTSYPAVALFLERARAVLPTFALQSDADGRMLADICARLDGLPLAIELAAAHVRSLSLRAIHEQLAGQSPLTVLTGGARDLAEHQRSMWSAIDWSYALLTPDERRLFRALSVFSGGAPEDAGVYGVSAEELREGLLSLADKSLIHWEDGPGDRRYFMLEMVRAYGQERLREAGELDVAQARRADYCTALAMSLWSGTTRSRRAEYLARLEGERDNLSATLRWACAQEDSAPGLHLAGLLWPYWYERGYLSEGRAWLDELLALDERQGRAAEPPMRARALEGAGTLAYGQGDFARATSLLEACVALRREIGHADGVFAAQNNLALIAEAQGDYTRAAALHEEKLAYERRLAHDPIGAASSSLNLGNALAQLGDLPRAEALIRESEAAYRAQADDEGVAEALQSLSEIALVRDDVEGAESLVVQGLAIARRLGGAPQIASLLASLGDVKRKHAEYAAAEMDYHAALSLYGEIEALIGVARCLEGLAGLACDEGKMRRAATLFGAAEAARELQQAPVPPLRRRSYERDLAAARAELGDTAFTAAFQAGRLTAAPDFVALAGQAVG